MVYLIAAVCVAVCIVAMYFAWKVFRENKDFVLPDKKKEKKDQK